MTETLPYHTDSGMYVLLTPSDLLHVNAISKNGDFHVRNHCYQSLDPKQHHHCSTWIITKTISISTILIQVLNTGDDSVILILGTGLTSWLLPGEGTSDWYWRNDNDFEERKRRGDKGLYGKRPDFCTPASITMMTNDHAGLYAALHALPSISSISRPRSVVARSSSVIKKIIKTMTIRVFEWMILQNHHIHVISLINDRRYGVWIHDIITTSKWSMIVITGCGLPLTMQSQVLFQLHQLLGW